MANRPKSIWIRYWAAYGGVRGLVRSRYFWIAILGTGVTYGCWTSNDWWELPLQVIPNLLGFSIGGLAILIGVIQPETVALLAGREDKPSPISQFTATFTHFVLVQGMSLFLAFACKAVHANNWPPIVIGFPIHYLAYAVSFFMFTYALTLTFATAIQIYRFSEILQMIARHRNDEENGVWNGIYGRVEDSAPPNVPSPPDGKE